MTKKARRPGLAPVKAAAARSCQLCRGGDWEILHDRIRSGKETMPCLVYRCRGCGLVFLDPAQRKAPLTEYYTSGAYRKNFSPYSDKPSPETAQYFKEVHLPMQRQRYERLAKLFPRSASVLEIGCASGGFLYTLKDKVAYCAGVELDARHAAHGRSLGLTIHNAPLETISFDRRFDFICLFHVLEHLPEPLAFAEKLRGLLKPGGKLVIEVPGVEDPLLRLFDVNAYKNFYFQVPHLYYFSQKTLSELLRRAGFASFKFSSFQHYSLLNNLSWALNGAPFNTTRQQGGSSVPPPERLGRPDPAIGEIMGALDAAYRRELARRGWLDTLLCTASAAKG